MDVLCFLLNRFKFSDYIDLIPAPADGNDVRHACACSNQKNDATLNLLMRTSMISVWSGNSAQHSVVNREEGPLIRAWLHHDRRVPSPPALGPQVTQTMNCRGPWQRVQRVDHVVDVLSPGDVQLHHRGRIVRSGLGIDVQRRERGFAYLLRELVAVRGHDGGERGPTQRTGRLDARPLHQARLAKKVCRAAARTHGIVACFLTNTAYPCTSQFTHGAPRQNCEGRPRGWLTRARATTPSSPSRARTRGRSFRPPRCSRAKRARG